MASLLVFVPILSLLLPDTMEGVSLLLDPSSSAVETPPHAFSKDFSLLYHQLLPEHYHFKNKQNLPFIL